MAGQVALRIEAEAPGSILGMAYDGAMLWPLILSVFHKTHQSSTAQGKDSESDGSFRKPGRHSGIRKSASSVTVQEALAYWKSRTRCHTGHRVTRGTVIPSEAGAGL